MVHIFVVSLLNYFCVIGLNYMALKVSLMLGTHNKQCLLIPLRANLWGQLDLLFSIHGQSYSHTQTNSDKTHKCKPIQINTNLYVS